MDKLHQVSRLEQRINSRHPILCSILTGIVSALIVSLFNWMWIRAKIEIQKSIKSNKTVEYRISNVGILPATTTYSVISPDSVVVDDSQSKGYIIYDEKTKQLKIDGLPQNKEITFNVIGSDVVDLKSVK